MKFLDQISKDATQSNDGTGTCNVIDQITDPTKLQYHLIDAAKGRSKTKRYRSLRLSEIDKCCPREYVLGNLLDLEFVDTVRFANLWMMDMGSALHYYVQNSPNYFGNKLIGWWRCLACGYIRRFGVRPTEPCEQCKAHPRVTEYHEYMFRISNPFRVVGKIDLILRMEPRVNRFAEIKTIGKDVDCPQGDHVAQLASYVHFSKFDDKLPVPIDRSTAYLIYFNKMFNWKSPVKVFTIKVNKTMLAPLEKKAGAITTGVRQRELPPVLENCLIRKWQKGRAKQCGIPSHCQRYYEKGVTQINA